ncbi:helix-turn-helix domain-containing protein [Chryseobacterium edaphi]|uniref:helix-turn-helix domain-containing protein n=1 Tax=Chryseobacterium edaphi TaxID=2976532 RepID=UPI0034A55960
MKVISAGDGEADYSGRSLIIHSDFLRNYPLMKTIQDFGFFSYSVNEALHLSETEKATIMKIFESIEVELLSSIDHFSQDIIISQIEQLLNYSNRFYNRQFITRKTYHNDHLSKLDDIISDFLNNDDALLNGVPSIYFLAEKIGLSQRYLSDMLQSITGMNSQQYLQSKMVEKAKVLLSTSTLSVSEIAYRIGFEYPQSFNKFFKKQTELSPLEFRNSFN